MSQKTYTGKSITKHIDTAREQCLGNRLLSHRSRRYGRLLHLDMGLPPLAILGHRDGRGNRRPPERGQNIITTSTSCTFILIRGPRPDVLHSPHPLPKFSNSRYHLGPRLHIRHHPHHCLQQTHREKGPRQHLLLGPRRPAQVPVNVGALLPRRGCDHLRRRRR